MHPEPAAAPPDIARRQVWPAPIEFSTAAEERTDRKMRLAAAIRIFAQQKYDEGIAGHLSVRDPELQDCFWVNPFGVPFSSVSASDLLLVDLEGGIREGLHEVNRSAWALHAPVLAARPDINSVVHAHSIYGRAWSATGRMLEPLTQDSCVFYQDHTIIDFDGLLRTWDQGAAIAAGLGGCKAAILKNHGLLTVGRTVDEAAWWFIAMDRACHIQLLAEAAGLPSPIDGDLALATSGGPLTDRVARYGWASFQPMFTEVTASSPDLMT